MQLIRQFIEKWSKALWNSPWHIMFQQNPPSNKHPTKFQSIRTSNKVKLSKWRIFLSLLNEKGSNSKVFNKTKSFPSSIRWYFYASWLIWTVYEMRNNILKVWKQVKHVWAIFHLNFLYWFFQGLSNERVDGVSLH